MPILPCALSAQPTHLIVSGTGRDSRSGDPIVAVSVVYDSVVVALTERSGTYRTPELSVRGSAFTLLFRRVGYMEVAHEVLISDSGTTVSLNVVMLPAPADLERIVVEGKRVAVANLGLIGFYERRERGFGRYLTEDEIERVGGPDLTNQLRRLRVYAEPRDQRDPFSIPTFSSCYVAFVDGIRLMDLTTIDEWVPASSLGAIEAHRVDEVSNLPREFVTPPPPGCDTIAGIVMFWSKVQRAPSPFEVGLHLGGLYCGASNGTAEYAGASFRTRVQSGDSSLRLQMDADGRLGGEGHVWQAFANLTTRPLGSRSPWHCGTGGGVSKRDTPLGGASGESLAAHHSVLTGLSFVIALTRPFAEVLLLDPFQPSRTSMGLRLGVRLLLGS